MTFVVRTMITVAVATGTAVDTKHPAIPAAGDANQIPRHNMDRCVNVRMMRPVRLEALLASGVAPMLSARFDATASASNSMLINQFGSLLSLPPNSAMISLWNNSGATENFILEYGDVI